MALSIAPQSEFFYRAPWTEEMDGVFLSVFVKELSDQPPIKGQILNRALLMAKGKLNQDHGLYLDWEQTYSRYKHMKK